MAANLSACSPTAAGGGWDSNPNPSNVCAGARTALPCALATPTDNSTSRRSMSTNSPDSGRFDQSAFAVTWNSTTRPPPSGISVTSGVPSAKRRPGPARQIGAGFGQHLPVDLDLLGNRQAGERRVRWKRRHPGGLAPGQRAAKLAIPGEQPHRQQRVGVVGRRLGRSRAGEADQQPALAHPGIQRVPLRPVRQRPIGQHQHRDVPLQQRRRIAFAQFGERSQRALAGNRSSPVNGVSAVARSPDSNPTGRRRQRSSSSTTDPALGGPCSTRRVSRLRSSGGSGIGPDATRRTGRHGDVGPGQGAPIAALRQHRRLGRARTRRLRQMHDKPVRLAGRRQQQRCGTQCRSRFP